MRKLDKLIKEARESCEWRGHRMAKFRHYSRHVAASHCLDCMKTVSVMTRPMPNEIEIRGEAVALNCG